MNVATAAILLKSILRLAFSQNQDYTCKTPARLSSTTILQFNKKNRFPPSHIEQHRSHRTWPSSFSCKMANTQQSQKLMNNFPYVLQQQQQRQQHVNTCYRTTIDQNILQFGQLRAKSNVQSMLHLINRNKAEQK